jgi:hypothetical protein
MEPMGLGEAEVSLVIVSFSVLNIRGTLCPPNKRLPLSAELWPSLSWFLSDLTYLPSDLFSLWHHQNMLGATDWTRYLRDSNRISLSFRLLRMVILFFAVQWFYRSGPAVQEYFLASSDGEMAPE